MMKSIVALFFLMFCAAAFSAPLPTNNQATASVDTLKTMLWWLPENTETLIVAHDPFKLIRFDSDSAPVELRQFFRYRSVGDLSIQKERFYD